jgi:2-haloacid dehalogenase
VKPLAPSAVVFDAYGTLFDVTAVAEACADVTPDAAAFAALWRQKQLEYTWLRNSMGRHADFETVTADALDHVAERLSVRLDAPVRQPLLDSWLQVPPFADVAAALDRLGSVATLAILSNGTPQMLAAALDCAGLGERFAAVLSVESVGVYKPDPRVYALAPEALRVEGSRLLFVSANGWDVAGASAARLPAVYLSRAGLPEERLGASPVATVRGLRELADLVVGPAAGEPVETGRLRHTE